MNRKFRHIVKAWYIDDGIVLEGVYSKKLFKSHFIPRSGIQCGFNRQRIWKKDIGDTLYFSKALAESKSRNS